jgi:outer membrane protein insertion porin family
MSALGDARYARASLQWQQFFPITNKFSWMFNAQLDWGMGLGGRKYPIFKNYYAGGLGSVRVFEANSLGPVDLTGSNIGGNLRANVNAELYIPVPGAGNDKSFRLFTFVDAGNVWDTKSPLYKVSLDSIRVSAGIGISWMSPMGPLKLSMGKPIRKEAKDRIEKFQFQVGTAF